MASRTKQSPAEDQARTRLTRTAVIDAARALFLERGYAATTIDTVSKAACTSPATVYRLFSSKLGLLKALLDTSITGDAEAVAFAERPDIRALLADPDPHAVLNGFARVVTTVLARSGPVHQILASAAGSDPDAAALLAEYSRQRQHGQARVARSLARAKALRPGVRERDAADIVHALTSPEVYALLTTDRSWSPERYEGWLAGILIDQLLPRA